MAWGIKRLSNDELRQRFVDATVPQAELLGLRIPDDELRFNEATGHYETGPIDWAEFWRVIGGNGPCNRDRMAAQHAKHEKGRWVREAALAHAARKAERRATAEAA